jgi:hypothetical protein
MHDSPLCIAYPVLYDEALDKKCSVYDVCARGWVVQFKTRLHELIKAQWHELAVKLNNFSISDSKDVTYWKWTTSKCFTVKSVYEYLTRSDDSLDYKQV